MNSTKLGVFTPVLAILWLVFSAGCANLSENRDLPDDERVRIRAQAWADALMAGDVETAYSFTSPNYRQYARWGRYNAEVAGSSWWTGLVLNSVRCSEDVCDVTYIVNYKISHPMSKASGATSRRRMDYKWVEVDGQWWLYVPAK
jgi:hypothetical protein